MQMGVGTEELLLVAYVVKESKQDLILGIPFLDSYEAHLDQGLRVLTLNGYTTVKCDVNTRESGSSPVNIILDNSKSFVPYRAYQEGRTGTRRGRPG